MANSQSLADAVAALIVKTNNMEKDIESLRARVDALENTRSITTTTPPTADGTGLPAFVVLDTKPEVEYKNYVYIYPRN